MAALIYGIVLILLPCLNAVNVMKLLNALNEGIHTRHENYRADVDVQHTEVDLRAGAKLCGKPADVMFVIDSSGSISKDDFEKQIKFVQELVKSFDIGPDTTRVAALTFSHRVRIEFLFNQFDTVEKVVQRVGKIVHANGVSTSTNDALKAMRTAMFGTTNGARSDVSKICILLTDGQSNNEVLTLQEATVAKQQGIKIFAVGIGDKVKDAELEAVVSPPAQANYFKTPSFDRLQSPEFQELVGHKACEGN